MATQATHFEYDGFAEIGDKLKELAINNPKLKKKVDDAIWSVLGGVRKAAQANAEFENSTHNSIQAIRRSVYKNILGGSVSILGRKRKANRGSFKATGQSSRTKQINSYQGIDRDFILRFVNSGTRDRYAGGRNNTKRMKQYVEKNGRKAAGFRGKIEPRNFFATAATRAMIAAADKLAEIIEDEIAKQLSNG